jgi:hypothetical protein
MSDKRIRATRYGLTPRPTLGSVNLAEFTLDGRPVTKRPTLGTSAGCPRTAMGQATTRRALQ